MSATELAEELRGRLSDVMVARDEVTATVDRGDLLATLAWLRDEHGFDMLMSVAATDWPGSDPRYWIAYELRSLQGMRRIRVKVGLSDVDPVVPSATGLFPNTGRSAWRRKPPSPKCSTAACFPPSLASGRPNSSAGHACEGSRRSGAPILASRMRSA